MDKQSLADSESTKIESWDQIISTGQFDISKEKPKIFRVGPIFDNSEDIMEDYEYEFILCKVAVGKSYYMTQQTHKEKFFEGKHSKTEIFQRFLRAMTRFSSKTSIILS